MKDPDFNVSNATENDAIHASKSDLPKIFKITYSQIQNVFAGINVSNNTDTISSSGSSTNVLNSGNDCSMISKQHALLMAESPEVLKFFKIYFKLEYFRKLENG